MKYGKDHSLPIQTNDTKRIGEQNEANKPSSNDLRPHVMLKY